MKNFGLLLILCGLLYSASSSAITVAGQEIRMKDLVAASDSDLEKMINQLAKNFDNETLYTMLLLDQSATPHDDNFKLNSNMRVYKALGTRLDPLRSDYRESLIRYIKITGQRLGIYDGDVWAMRNIFGPQEFSKAEYKLARDRAQKILQAMAEIQMEDLTKASPEKIEEALDKMEDQHGGIIPLIAKILLASPASPNDENFIVTSDLLRVYKAASKPLQTPREGAAQIYAWFAGYAEEEINNTSGKPLAGLEGFSKDELKLANQRALKVQQAMFEKLSPACRDLLEFMANHDRARDIVEAFATAYANKKK